MLLTVTALADLGPVSPTPAPPPTAPKPPKHHARLQHLLRKAAKRSGVPPPPSQPPKSFRSTLSPVSEADLEGLEPAAYRPHLPPPLYLPPRFQIRPVIFHVASPYSKHHSFTFTVSEKQSLSQYLGSPVPPDTPAPHAPRTSTPDRLMPRPPGTTSPHPTGATTTKPTPPAVTPPPKYYVPATPVLKLPVIPQKSGGPLPLEVEMERQLDTGVTNAEIGYCTPKPGDTGTARAPTPRSTETPRSFPTAQEGATDKISGNCPPTLEMTPTLQPSLPPTFGDTDIRRLISPCPGGADTTSPILPPSSGAKDKTLSLTALRATDTASGTFPAPPEATPRSPCSGVTNTPRDLCSPTMGGSAHVIPVLEAAPLSLKEAASEEPSLLKSPERPRPPRKKPGKGWARLVKHLVVEPEEQKYPEQETPEGGEAASGGATEAPLQSRGARANKMWDTLLYHMVTSTGGQEKPGSTAPLPLPFLRSRLPLLLNRPRFDARKLKEAASRPLRRVNAFFHRRPREQPASNFNRTASGWSIRGEEAVGEGTSTPLNTDPAGAGLDL
ncbi:proline-rich protein 33 [Ascaphus truei]|uniref:proline-rich protein 33 n=1 Tax=Ascaphus truei TaxID=8439 RepID=UPI003F595B52